MRDYKDVVTEYGIEFADAVSAEEYNQFIRGIERPAASFYPFEEIDDYPGYIENIGVRKVRAYDEIMYRMEEGI